jgi:hypothetical protein
MDLEKTKKHLIILKQKNPAFLRGFCTRSGNRIYLAVDRPTENGRQARTAVKPQDLQLT